MSSGSALSSAQPPPRPTRNSSTFSGARAIERDNSAQTAQWANEFSDTVVKTVLSKTKGVPTGCTQ